ncbi:two-component system sensor histidine kinase NtrB [Methylocystis parvus]|uniref:Sensor protein FixL n=1 Tax=Methylocystis parvus TaxID=134 RepID=A0A6B8M8Y3_9HYPH|nr:PAS domain S-box protein [Methylocystis parvus]QGM98089.1 PAS domain S-box protein [Methylocystis parvus]WBK01590.1 PAS domain S-box protein [Methylocystis parvus OBBP]
MISRPPDTKPRLLEQKGGGPDGASDAYLAAVVKGALDGIISIDDAGTILSFNPAATRLFGYAPEEVIGENVSILMPEPYRSEHDDYIRNYVHTGKAKIIGVGRTVEGRRKDGSVFPMDLGVTEVATDQGRVFVGVVHDLSERRRFETRMRELHADRLGLIENMAVGLAHELKQPLAAINAYLGIARRALKELGVSSGTVDQALESVTGQVFRVSDIVDSLRQFISRGETVKTPQNLNEVVRSACEFTDAMAKEQGVKTTVRLDATPDRVIINKVQVQQVVVNLKRNAIEAMQGCERRELTVSTRLVAGDMMRTDVADTGPGVPQAIKEKLFEPFTTTKPHGLGVGLSLSRSIIEAHHGKLWAEDNPGGGTIFSFVLPLAEP